MVTVKKEGIILSKTHLKFENKGVLNPAVIRMGDQVQLIYRAIDPNDISTLGYCLLDGPLTVAQRWHHPLLSPEFEYESHGMEDPRVVKIEETYFLSYTGFDGINARGALLTSTDLITFEHLGIVVPPITYSKFVYLAEVAGKVNKNYYQNHSFYYQGADPDTRMFLWDKDIIFFPRRINNKLVFLHRIRPGIQIVQVNEISELTTDFWKEYLLHLQEKIVLDPIYKHEINYIGGGCPPIETEHGWLLIYHGVCTTEKGLTYSACAALLNLENPSEEVARLPYPLFSPDNEWEQSGIVNNVVFPTGTTVFGSTLFIYYGAADACIACASMPLQALIDELLAYQK